MDFIVTFVNMLVLRLFNEVAANVRNIVRVIEESTDATTTTTTTTTPMETAECSTTVNCFLESCHRDCLANTVNKKCKPDKSSYDGDITFKGTCVECIAHNQCPGQGCDFTTNTCTADARQVDPYTPKADAIIGILNPMYQNQGIIGGFQTSGASVAQVFANTRLVYTI